MPLYFAYGSNMDEAAMRSRCPGAKALGRGRLARHRFVLMGRSGYASVRRDPHTDVHGVLFNLALSDMPPLDFYEDVANGLYAKAIQPILREGAAACQALVYFGADPTEGGMPPRGYMEAIVAAARVARLPDAHITMLERFVPGRFPSPLRGGARGGGRGPLPSLQ